MTKVDNGRRAAKKKVKQFGGGKRSGKIIMKRFNNSDVGWALA